MSDNSQESRAAAVMARLASWSYARARPVAALAAALTAAAGLYFAANLEIRTSTTDMLSEDLPFRQNQQAASDAFPKLSDNILIVVEGVIPDTADEAAIRLAAALEKQDGAFTRVLDFAGLEFFRRNGLLFLSVDELEDLTFRLAQAQPFLGALSADPTIRGFANMMSLAIDEVGGGGDTGFDMTRALDAVSEVAEAQAEARFMPLSWERLMRDKLDETGAARRFINVQPKLDFSSLEPAARAIRAIYKTAEDLGLDESAGVRIRLTGSAVLEHEELQSVQQGMGLAGALAFTIVTIVLVWGLGSIRAALAVLVTLAAGLVFTAAFAILALGSLNLISVAFAVLFVGLGVDFGIHMALRCREEAAEGAEDPVGEGTRRVGYALGLCTLTSMTAFFAFLPTDYTGLAELGLIAGAGMVIALAVTIILLPALIRLFGAGHAARRPVKALKWTGPAARAIQNNGRAITLFAAVLGVSALWFAKDVRFDFDPMNLRDPDAPAMRTYLDIIEGDKKAPPLAITALASSAEEARAWIDELKALDVVRDVESVFAFAPRNMEDKLDLIDAAVFYLLPALEVGLDTAPPDDAARKQVTDDLTARLRDLTGRQGATPLGASAARLAGALEPIARDSGLLREFERRITATLPSRLEIMKTSFEPDEVTLETLPPVIRDDYITADGRYRLRILPKEDVRAPDALDRFVNAVQAVVPQASGSPVTIKEAGDAVVGAFLKASAIALVVITIILIFALRSVRDIAFVFIPLVLAAVLTGATSVLIGVPFNFANVIVLPLLFGLSVDFGIHLVLRERENRGRGEGGVLARSSTTPRAVFCSALTTIGSFGAISLSAHVGTASMGILLTVALTHTLFCGLIVLPAVMAWTERARPPA
ncbi:MAG: MMPL family transporter [Rhodospirillales bacterium]